MLGQPFFNVNDNDQDLKPIKVDIHALVRKNAFFWYPGIQKEDLYSIIAPAPNLIRNYGKDRKDQYWTREELPPRLAKLEKQCSGDQKKIWDYLADHKTEYQKEIEFVKKQWFHRIFGEWIYINGEPVWIDPWHWFFLSTWQADYQVIDRATGKKKNSKYAEYRDRDRRKFHFFLMAFLATENFKNIGENGKALDDEMYDTFERVCIGVNYPKHRRDGATQNCLSIQYQMTTQLMGMESFIIANKPETQKKHFHTKLIKAWRKQPFYFRPTHDGTDRPKRKLHFIHTANRQKGGELEFNQEGELESYIEFCEVIDRAVYDNLKVTGIDVDDENGKTTGLDVYEAWQVKKPSFTQGGESTINPYCLSLHPSTVEEMERMGGANYKMLCDDSDYYERNRITGQTASGLWTLFIPAYDGLENYVGPYGESIIDDPTPEQAAYTGRNHGSKEYIASRIESYKKKGTPKALRDLASFTRKHPMCYADCWRTQGGDLGFNKENLHSRLEELERQITEKKDPRKRGDFWWKIPGDDRLISAEEYVKQGMDRFVNQTHRVVWEYSEDGPWYMSDMIEENQSNLRTWDSDKGMFRLRHEPTKIIGIDPGKYQSIADAERREDKAKYSFQAAAIYDTMKKNFIASLMVKIDSIDVFSEKCLMAAIYFNAEALIELNVGETLRWFEQRRHGSFGGGNGGFLKHLFKVEQNEYAQLPGVTTGGGVGGTKDTMFNCVKDYIGFMLHKENHYEIIEQWNAIGGKEEMNKYDLFAASAICLLGEKMSYVRISDSEYGQEKEEEKFNINDWMGEARTGVR